MDADGLPLVGPGINLAQVDPIIPKRMLAFLNHFIIHTVGFLNRFSGACEEKLENLTVRIQRLETTVTILETKLQSIPGLDDITAASLGVQHAVAISAPAATVTNDIGNGQNVTTSLPADTTATSADQVLEQADESSVNAREESSANKASNDPRYSKYFKLLAMKIPREALQQRMVIEGLDPSILDNPDAVLVPDVKTASTVAPPAVSSTKNQNQKRPESDHDFSDDGNDDEDGLSTGSSAGSSDFS